MMVEVLQPTENFDYGETDRTKMSSGDVFFSRRPLWFRPRRLQSMQISRSIMKTKAAPILPRLRSHIWIQQHRAHARTATAGCFLGSMQFGKGGSRKAETKKDRLVKMFSPQIMEHLRRRVSEATDASLASARRDLININAIDKLCTHLGLD